MTPVVTNSVNNIPLIPTVPFLTRKNENLKRFNLVRCSTKQTLCPINYISTLSNSVRLFPQLQTKFNLNRKPRATGTDIALEEAVSPVSDAESSATSAPTATSESTPSPAQAKRSRPARKSDMPPVKPEDLVSGATFTGKVRSIKEFGAFVDFGAFTDGLVHVSQLSDGFVKDVGSIVSVGQEVSVRLVEANRETNRISLTMRVSDEGSNKGPAEMSRPSRKGPPRPREAGKKTSKFTKGQELEGTVKNFTKSGTFISLPGGEEGFLPHKEEEDGGVASMMGDLSLQDGQKVLVRVLESFRGKVKLTMKKEEDASELDTLKSEVFKATSPFLLAFKKDEGIASFLDERAKVEERKAQVDADVGENVSVGEEVLASDVVESEQIATDSVATEEVPEAKVDDDVAKEEAEVPQASVVEDVSTITISEDEKVEASLEDNITLTSTIEGHEATKEVENVTEEVAESQQDDVIAKIEIEEANTEDTSSITSSSTSEEIEASKEIENENDATQVKGKIETEIADSAVEAPLVTLVEEEADPSPAETTKEIEESKEVENVAETPNAPNENTEVKPVAEVKDAVTVSSEETSEPSTNGSITKATISPALVKQLRDETGAGMMDCKNALSETGGDLVKAQEFLRKKGLSSADKKASRATAEGRIGSYIHDSRIGVLIEVNCETDFVSRGDIFKELVDDLAMQVAACPQVQYLVTDDVDKELIEREREIEMQKEDLLSKPEQIREKIVDGRIRKRLEELALLEQPFIKNDKMVVKDWVKQTIATIGENIKVKRFVRFNLGEGLQKKSQDFAAEVAAQTAAKSPPLSVKTEAAAVVEEKPVVDAPKVAVSAALVKQLRDETGAGMMDCKKALSETGGDLEKAQEYLRKKGLSTADKKSSRIAAEGRIGAYIHDTRIGVLIEVNCETDFVGRSEKFKELANDLAMQVVACPQVKYVSIEDIPEDFVRKEKEMEMQREDLQSKPESIREKIVEGRVSKRLGELALLEQPFIKDDSVLVKDLVKSTVAGLGENIKVRRFVRFTLGESNEISDTENES